MNPWLLAAGVIAAVTAVVHVVAGHRDPVVPLLSDGGLGETTKWTLYAVWHMVSIDLVLAAAALCYWALAQPDGYRLGAVFVAAHFGCYAAVFVLIAAARGWSHWLLRLPQWTLLLPVAVLAFVGAR
ncbi:hypothetical protein [Actinophytocola xanthii]|uniref:DUF1304 domain-containing protein n=1 Tax=Actinophytocola xanthii TaxID=1912961 RepID=A0A1Q8C6I7_9PSEU|nr:hypothetical protein [Actinophytocola xanthii]OLF09967.1 hypothetical protein BU204_32330 [Actinophytocola xanthii]